MVLYTFLGIAVTSVGVLFGKPIWDPVQLIGMFHQPVVAFVALNCSALPAEREHRSERGVAVERFFKSLSAAVSFRTVD